MLMSSFRSNILTYACNNAQSQQFILQIFVVSTVQLINIQCTFQSCKSDLTNVVLQPQKVVIHYFKRTECYKVTLFEVDPSLPFLSCGYLFVDFDGKLIKLRYEYKN